MYRLLRENRDFRLLYLGSLISLGGDWFLTVALLDLVLSLTGSATLASLVLLCQTLPIFLLTPIAGQAVDRMDRRKLMIAVDVMRVGACLIPLLARSTASLPFAYVGVILISVGSAYFEPASQAALPNLVDEEQLGAANVLMGSTWGMMLAVGAGLGGLVTMRFGSDVAFLADAGSFLVSALLLWRMRARFSQQRARHDEQPPPLRESVRETIAYAKTHPRVLALLTSKGGTGIGSGVVSMLGVFGKEVFHSGAFGIGLLFAARGLGALLGPFLVRAYAGKGDHHGDRQYKAIGACVLLFGLGYVALGLSETLWLGAAAIFFAHMGGGAQWQTSTYGLQRETEDRIRGRVFAADWGFVTLTMSCSSLTSGLLSDQFGPVIATVGVATLCIAWAMFWSSWTWKLWR